MQYIAVILEKLIVRQEIVETENRINFLANRFPQPVERASAGFLDLNISSLGVGIPAQLLRNRPDVRQAERELAAAGPDVAPGDPGDETWGHGTNVLATDQYRVVLALR